MPGHVDVMVVSDRMQTTMENTMPGPTIPCPPTFSR